MKNITVIGGGSWGTALAQVLSDNQHHVTVYDRNPEVVEDINRNHQNSRFFEAHQLPVSLKAENQLQAAVESADFILMAVPTKVMREALGQLNRALSHSVTIINASKGIEPGTHKRVSEIVAEEISPQWLRAFVLLSGPSHAEEVINREVTTITTAGTDLQQVLQVQGLFNTDYFRVYRTDDLLGAEVGGSIKNVIALAAGILAGLGYGDNAKAALLTRGLVEIQRLGVALGAEEATFVGLSGLGDLIVTCTSPHSRNWQAGFKIGSGSNLQEALDSMTMVVEGVRTCQATYELACELNIEMPIVEAVYEVIFNKLEPHTAIRTLMNRQIRHEFY